MKPILNKGEIKRVKKLAVDNSHVEEVDREESLLSIVERELEKDGIVMFNNENINTDYLSLPSHLDEEEPNEIGRFLHSFTQQRIWTRTLLARIGILLKEANEDLDREKVRVFSEQPVKMSVTEKELKLYEDENSVEILERIKLISAKYDMLDAYMKNLEDAIFDISREISRRGYDFNSQNRAENISSYRKGK